MPHTFEPDDLLRGRERLRQIFGFLRDLIALRTPVRRRIEDQLWSLRLADLPRHPAVWLRSPEGEEDPNTHSASSDDGGVVLRVRRPSIKQPPSPAPEIAKWLPLNWKDPLIEEIEPLTHLESGGPQAQNEKSAAFEESVDRVRLFRNWKRDRDQWAREQAPARRALDVFNALYGLLGRIEREGESVQLYLGQGMLVWDVGTQAIYHPILLQRLQLSFDASQPEFALTETDHPPELYRPLLAGLQPGNLGAFREADDELAKLDCDLLDSKAVEGYLERIVHALHAQGRYCGTGRVQRSTGYPQIGCDPVLFLQRRTQGFATAMDWVLESLPEKDNLPTGLLRVTGIEPSQPARTEPQGQAAWEEPEGILLTKEANAEQVQIAERLARHGNVIVQGPPGTGKTHTIANLIGHLLAHGKTVLVTAHTSKALRVLRDKVAYELQSLCVSVLDDEAESRRQLESSVDAMVARLSADDPEVLTKRANTLEQERKSLTVDLREERRALVRARQDEYRDIIVDGHGISPAEASRFVSATQTVNGWIPGPVDPAAPLPLSEREVHDLYATNALISPDDEVELSRWRPDLGDLPSEEEFRSAVRRLLTVSGTLQGIPLGADWWEAGTMDTTTEEELMQIAEHLRRSVTLLADVPGWKLDVVAAGMNDADTQRPWVTLISRLESLKAKVAQCANLILDRGPVLAKSNSPADQADVADEIAAYLERGGKLLQFRVWFRPAWRDLISNARVDGGRPRLPADFRAIAALARVYVEREELGHRWQRQVTDRGGPAWKEFGDKPEDGASIFVPAVTRLLEWHVNSLTPLVGALCRTGFKWDVFIEERPFKPGEHAILRRLIEAVVEDLPRLVTRRIAEVQQAHLERTFNRWPDSLFPSDRDRLPAGVVLHLRRAISDKDVDLYARAIRTLIDLKQLEDVHGLRGRLLGCLKSAAAAWSASIEARRGPHGAGEPQGPVGDAWRWLQYSQEIDERGKASMSDLQARIGDLQSLLHQVTAKLIEARAWASQCGKITLAHRQALIGWKDIVRRIGKGTGKRAPGLRAAARRTLFEARAAVPVWIMPLARVAETFDPRVSHFDVVIVDEASQCDLLGLLAVYMADQVVVVGDHEQVSPSAVGQEVAEVERLIDQHLEGIPNRVLYDGKASLYDLARQAFGGVIRLLEHFRCVPDIIAFSNQLSYGGDIRPLREETSTTVLPAIVEHRIEGQRLSDKTNREEAQTIVVLMAAMLQEPAYERKSFGVISLLGEEQALRIDALARRCLRPERLKAAHFLCGNAAQFQGDERDVVLLSLVDTAVDGPLPMRDTDMFRQRFNVAVSRARDQLWVVHSLTVQSDVKPGDLRRRLIEHAQDPTALRRLLQRAERRAESEFERRVMADLVNAGYRVRSQWEVGSYRIDLVVEGGGRRMAVECDGDRYHAIEQVAADMARQAVLERLGWRFVRIRGSQYFRDPKKAMRPVFDVLSHYGVVPEGPIDATSAGHSPSTLRDKVTRRAAELLRDWECVGHGAGEAH